MYLPYASMYLYSFYFECLLKPGLTTCLNINIFFHRMLGRGSMFIFSRSQLVQLLDLPDGWQGENLLDLGILYYNRPVEIPHPL